MIATSASAIYLLHGIFIPILLGIGVWWLISKHEKRRAEQPDIKKRRAPFISPGGGSIVIDGFRFFPSRDILSQDGFTLAAQLDRCETAWVYWVSGRKEADGLSPERFKKIDKLLLPNPSSNSVDDLRHSLEYMSIYKTLPDEIRNTTQRAIESNISVKWYPEFVGIVVMIFDPTQNRGYVQIDISLPHLPPNERIVFHFYKTQQEEVFDKIVKTYNLMFDSAHPPMLGNDESTERAPGTHAEAKRLLDRWKKRWGPYGPEGYKQDNTLEADTTSFLRSYCVDYATRRISSSGGDPKIVEEVLGNIDEYLKPEFRR